MKINTNELHGTALDWAVAKCEGLLTDNPHDGNDIGFILEKGYIPSTDWSQGGPIIERENIEIKKGNPLYFPQGNEKGDYYEDLWIAGKMHGTTFLIAAMRCYVASKLGDVVDIPEGL